MVTLSQVAYLLQKSNSAGSFSEAFLSFIVIYINNLTEICGSV